MSTGRDYRKEYDDFHSKPVQIKRRNERNKARDIMKKKGLVKKNDGMDVHHKNHNTHDNSSKNLAVLTVHKNRADNGKK